MNDSRIYADLDQLVRLEHRARGFSFLPRQPIHSILAGRHASRLRGRGLNFEEIRGYLPGDDVRTMDWKVTARMRKPHVRVYTEERDRPVLFLVDQRSSMFFGSRRTMKSVAAAEAAALGAWKVLAAGDRVGALVFNDEEITSIKAHRSRGRVRQLLGAIIEKNCQLGKEHSPPANPGMLNEALSQTRQIAKHDHLICIISDFNGMNPDTKRLITLLSAHNDVMSLFIYDPLEAQLPNAGRLHMAESELQLEVNTGEKKLRQQFANDFKERLERMKNISRGRSIPFLPIETSHDVTRQIRDQLGAAIGQGRKAAAKK
ncbi:MAG: DUF58 domain-containing protein [Verrucomicrobiota bacterium]